MNAAVRAISLLCLLVLGVHAGLIASTGRVFDLRAFYCAGVVANAGADPYRYQPLQRCELATAGLAPGATEAVIPAPLPGYDVAILRLLARLPFAAARLCWMLAVVAAFVGAARGCARLGRTGTRFACAVLAVAGVSSLNSGQVAPFALAGIVLAACALAEGRDARAVLALALVWVEPHLALGATLAVFLARPRTRLPLLALGAALVALSLLGIGAAANLEYATTALARHAASEIAHERQLGLTHLAHLLGAADATALRLGAWSYLAMLVCGIAVARRLARVDACALVVVPALFSVVGGAYIHEAQIVAAVPALFFLVRRAGDARLTGAAFGALAVPWMQVLADPILDVAAAAIVLMLIEAPTAGLRSGIVVALPLLALGAAARGRLAPIVADRYATFHPHALATASASDVWALWVARTFTADVAVMTCAAVVTWTALALAATLLCRRAIRSRPVAD